MIDLPNYFIYLVCCIGSIVSVFLIIPKIIIVSKYRNLADEPNERSSHIKKTPRLGGFIFFINIVFGMYVVQAHDLHDRSIIFITSMLVIFVVGLKDDLKGVNPKTKLYAQLISCLFVVLHPDFYVNNLHGFLGFHEVNPYLMMPIVLMFMITFINAFNLVDGIDGLASIIGILIFSFFLGLFMLLNKSFYIGLCLVVIFSLLTFMFYNFKNDEKKIFMGDTGSLLLGLLISIFTLRLFTFDQELISYLPIKSENYLIVLFAILSLPFFDLFRVFILRTYLGKSPFKPDKRHLHHIMIYLFDRNHLITCLYIALLNIFIFGLVLSLSYYFDSYRLLFVFFLLFITYITALFFLFNDIQILRRKLRKKKIYKKLKFK